MKKKVLLVALFCCVFGLFGIAGQMDYEDAVMAEKHYCEMVTAYKQSNGQHGWPDFKNLYLAACDEAATK